MELKRDKTSSRSANPVFVTTGAGVNITYTNRQNSIIGSAGFFLSVDMNALKNEMIRNYSRQKKIRLKPSAELRVTKVFLIYKNYIKKVPVIIKSKTILSLYKNKKLASFIKAKF